MVTDLNTQRVQRTKLNLQVLQSFGYSPTRGFKSRAEESISLDLINQLEAVDRPIWPELQKQTVLSQNIGT